MKKKYFGQGCKYFIGKWETCDVDADTERTEYYKEYAPVLSFCNHPDNKEDVEGNCRKELCPLLFNEFIQNQKDIPKEYVDIINEHFWDIIG